MTSESNRNTTYETPVFFMHTVKLYSKAQNSQYSNSKSKLTDTFEDAYNPATMLTLATNPRDRQHRSCFYFCRFLLD